MDRVSLIERLSQADSDEFGDIFEGYVRGAMRYALIEAMHEEVAALCGVRHGRGGEHECYRAGSAPGTAFFGADSAPIRRPRVRRKAAAGNREQTLATYEAGRRGEGLREAIMRGFVAGVSGRKMPAVTPSARRTSKSEVARTWEAKAGEYVAALRGRPLDGEPYVALMLDGVELSDGLTAVIALGVTEAGEKRMLDFEIGASESAEVATALVDRLVARGLRPAARRPLAVLDGSKALRRAVRAHWPEAAIQTCLVHVARRVRARLARRWHGELERLFKQLREAADLEAAQEARDELERFVAGHSAQGLRTLEAARDEMLTLFALGVPDTLNRSLLTTNSIENGIRNMRRLLGRVTRWRSRGEMATRWMACAMLEAEKGMRRIRGYRELPLLIAALDRDPALEEVARAREQEAREEEAREGRTTEPAAA